MISPFKAVLGGDYKVVEKRLARRDPHPLRPAAELADEITQQIKAADRGAAYLEATHLADLRRPKPSGCFGRDPGLPEAGERDYLTPWTAARPEKQLLERFKAVHMP